MAKEKEIDWNEGLLEYMPEDKLEIFLKKFEKGILKMKSTPEGRRRLAKSFGGTPAKYKL